MAWIVYLARCRDGSLYTGITTDPERRLKQHNQGLGGAYTRSRLPVTLVYHELAESRSHALRRERAIKALTRAAKEALALRQVRRSPPPTEEEAGPPA
ncbi:MAG TPA: GIY-YIG nuclease family protein [Gemmatimonadales bacterium]|nr:GIY-YIG nuclease family protein [Gemmatimonadales bacterium]